MASEEPVVVAVETAVLATTTETLAEENPAPKPKAGRKAKEPKAKKPAAPRKPRTAPTHPPYIEMINDAIVSLKERTGSSQYAIAKFIEEKHKQLPPNFKKLLLTNLRKLVASGKLVKVKGSYKLPAARPPAEKAPAKKEASGSQAESC